MAIPERRRLPRTTAKTLACVVIGEETIGVALNVSVEGLCFQCMFPVERNGPLRFSLVQNNRFVDACGELVWLDAAQTSGGVRFTTLSPEARGQIDKWTSQPLGSPQNADKAATAVVEPVAVCTSEPGISPPYVREPTAACTSKLEPITALRALYSRLWVREAHPSSQQRHRLFRARAFNPTNRAATRQPLRIAPDTASSWRTWNLVGTAVKQHVRQRWQAILDSIRVMAIGAEVDEIFERRYRTSLSNANAEDEQRLLAEFFQETEALEQERLTIASRRAVRAAEKYNIAIPSGRFKYNRHTKTLILPPDECLRVRRQVLRARRIGLGSQILWLAPLLGAITALVSVWLAATLTGGH